VFQSFQWLEETEVGSPNGTFGTIGTAGKDVYFVFLGRSCLIFSFTSSSFITSVYL